MKTFSTASPARLCCLRAALRLALGLIALTSAAAESAEAGPHPIPVAAWTQLTQHPRLFANATQWEAIRSRLGHDAVSDRLFALIRHRADAILEQTPVVISRRSRGALSGTMLEPAREVQRRVLALAAMSRLSGDERYHDRALVELHTLTALADWNPAVFLDTAEATLAVAVGYDWLYERLSPDERATLAGAIVDKGLRASFDAPAKVLTWIRGTNNWNQVCHGALVVGALAVADREPALAQRIVQRTIKELHSSAHAYAPDGVYPEGPTYWSYGTTFHVALLSALESALGDDGGLTNFPGFLRTAEYVNQVTAPSGNVFNYADSSLQRGFEPALFWFARHLRQPGAVSRELQQLAARSTGADDARSRFLPLALLWWDPSLLTLPAAPLPLHWKGDGPVPIAVHRSGWHDSRAVYLAIKGGRPGVSHGHMDVGSFVLEADGVRWAVDPGSQSYTVSYQSGIDVGLWRFTQDSPRWGIFRLGAEGHNLLRFDGAMQLVGESATIRRFSAAGPAPFTQLDLDAITADRVISARRGVRLLPDRRVVFQDEWHTGERSVTVTWQWLTHATITLERDAALLRQSGQVLRLRMLEPHDAVLSVDEGSRLLQAHDEPVPNLRRLVVRTKTAAGAAGRFVIVAEPGSATGTRPLDVQPLSAW